MEFQRCYRCMGELPAPGAVCPRCGFDNIKGPAEQPEHALPCGSVLNGKYVVGCLLGQGGFGITYLGYDLPLALPVCIKESFPEGAAMRTARQGRQVTWGHSESAQQLRESRQSFLKEAQKAVKLRDLPHIVSVWDVFFENDTAYLVMDYVPGENLKHRLLRTQRPLGERECVELLAPMLRDLEDVHRRGIIHQDIKPDNIMLPQSGEPVLLDLGAAKDLDRSRIPAGPASTMVVSQGFSPPEQYRQSGSVGPWTDVYAICATMYYSISGRVPPPAVDRMYEDRADFAAFSPAMARVLRRGMALKTEERIQTMGALGEQLRAAVGEREKPSPTPAPIPKPAPEPTLKPAPAPAPKPAPAPAPAPKPAPAPAPPIPPSPAPKPAGKTPGPDSKGLRRWTVLLSALALGLAVWIGVLSAGEGEKLRPEALTPVVSPEITPAPGTAAPASPRSGTTGEGLGYRIGSGGVTVTGCDKSAVSLEIPETIAGWPVVAIGDNAFYGCAALTQVRLPDSLESIGSRAFSQCYALRSVNFPRGVREIGAYAFDECRSLTAAELPESLESIGDFAFNGCRALGKIRLPEGVTAVGSYAFYKCSAVKSLRLPRSLTTVKDYAFFACDALTDIYYAGDRASWQQINRRQSSFPPRVNMHYNDQ